MRIIAGIDRDSDAAQTFRTNFPEAAFLETDIRDLRACDLDQHIDRCPRTYPLLFSFCAPCQPFSKQNHDKSDGHQAASLLGEMHRFMRRFRPDLIFLENVPGLQRVSKEDEVFSGFLQLLRTLKYHVDRRLVRSQDYGVPQHRQRLVLIGSRLGPIAIPSPTHGPGTANASYSTVWNWIADLPRLSAGGHDPKVRNHRCMALSPMNLERIQNTPEGGGRRDWPKHLRLSCHNGHRGHSDVYGRLFKDRPASALTTRCISLSNGRFGHPEQDRAISVREAACLQTFDRDFVFFGSLSSMARQIGNAVPVLLAEKIGLGFIEHRRALRRSGG